ncbi:hypothetical protein KAR91_88420 [Candidatus Pacearchaeota archaeon]|nr:hypothetical protein [Candidatus Pacearchaeota archaeon]
MSDDKKHITISVKKNKPVEGDVDMEEQAVNGNPPFRVIAVAMAVTIAVSLFLAYGISTEIDKAGGLGKAVGRFIGDVQQGIEESRSMEKDE